MLESESSGGVNGSRTFARSEEDKKRAWDWRKGLEKDAKGEDILRILRLGLAKDIARHWVTQA